MAKTKGEPTAKMNRVRMIVIDSDLSDDAVSDLSQAIASALRLNAAPGSPARVLNPGAQGQLAPSNGHEPPSVVNGNEADMVTGHQETADGDGDEPNAPGGASVSKTPRKLPLPEYLHDLDLKAGDVTFKDFATQKAPKKHAKRYLLAAYWLKEYGKQASVNANQVYTCYKTAGWPTNINDWDVNFRNHITGNRMRRVSPGEYVITPLGEDEVNKPAGE